MPSKYRVRWVNFNYYAQDEFDHLTDAVAYVDSKSFEAAVELNGEIVASKTTFSGWAVRDRELVPRSFTEVRKGDVILFGRAFHKVKEVLEKGRKLTRVSLESGSDAILDGLVFTKG